MDFRRLIYPVTLVLIAQACISNKIECFEPELDLVFDVVVSANTKSAEEETCYPKDVPFGVWSYSLPANKNWIEDNEDAIVAMSKEYVIYDMDNQWWKPEGRFFWTGSENNMSFFAYSPYSRECSFSKENGISIKGYSIFEDIDLMFSEGLYDLNRNVSNGVVHIPFVRALTLVDFKIRSSLPTGTTIRMKKLTVRDIATKGNFVSLPFARWGNLEDYQDIVFFEGDINLQNEPMDIGEAKFMIPQNMQPTIVLTCDIISGDYILPDQEFVTVGRMNWEIGRACTYNLKVTTDLTFIIESSLNE